MAQDPSSVNDSPRPRSATAGTLGTVRNAARLFELMSAGPSFHQLTELAEQAELTLPTVHRLLKSLVLHGLVRQDPTSSRYGLGPELLRLSAAAVTQHPALTAVGPYLCDLRNVTGVTIQVAVLAGRDVVYIDRVDGPECAGVFRNHSPRSATFETAAGKLLLAHSEPQLRDEIAQAAGESIDEDLWHSWAEAPFVLHLDPGNLGGFEVAVPLGTGPRGPIAALCATGPTRLLAGEAAAEGYGQALLKVARLAQGGIDGAR